jgi:DNA-binding CsgD family transcriptional regulator
MVRGAPAEATAYLRRALREPPPPEARPQVLRELGHAEGLRSDPAALAHLEAAIAETGEPRARAPVALELAQLLVFAGRPADARELLAREREEASGAGDGELQLRLTAALVGPTVFDLGWSAAGAWLDDLRAGLAADDDPVALACLAIEAATAGRSADETAALAERALAGDGLLREVTSDSQSYSQAWSALFVADRLDEATAALGAGLAEARERGSALGFVTASGFQAHVDYRAGRLHEGMANAQAALDVERLEGQSVEMIAAYARGFLVDLAVEMGELQLADRVIGDAALGGALPEQAPFDHLRHARGGLRLAQGRLQEAADDLLEAGRIFLGLGIPNPSWAPWRSNAALAQARLGNRDQASQLLAEELELARRFGAPRAIGIALRAAGLCAKGAAEIELLRESEAVLRRSPARLEHAKSSVELGAALRRHRSRREAREPLRAGLEFAERSGAAPLAERAREELAATGARPRRIVRSGTESLTASERRVATMAADGMSNPEIAQALFVTRRTVETHLTAVYRKLEISSRSELSGALAS